MHAELAAQTERLNRLIAMAIPGILISDDNEVVTNVSNRFGTLFGIAAPERLVGMQCNGRTWRIDVAEGVGLAVVRALVERHGGRVEVQSALGEGSIFSVFLPTSR